MLMDIRIVGNWGKKRIDKYCKKAERGLEGASNALFSDMATGWRRTGMSIL